jgi:hypothetical protein
MKKKDILFICLILSLPSFANGLDQDSVNSILNNPPPVPDNAPLKIVTPMSHLEFTLSMIVLGFGLSVVILEIYLIKVRKISSEDIIKFITITLIITSTLFLITAGYSNDQIAPAVGLLGTIAGYLLGRTQNLNQREDKHEIPS